ncbi:MAG: HAD family phosphatase [Actinomycetia bacterium]|nr:HAD family phosphatase [Actinomycetes bacterium]
MHQELSAVIFDMDGLMFDTERLGWQLLNQAGAEYGCSPISLERYTDGIGKTHTETSKIFSEICGYDYERYRAIERRFWDLDREYIRRVGPPLKPGLLDLLGTLEQRSVPCALASSTHHDRVAEHLKAAQLEAFFSVVIGGDQARASKPAPDIFLEAAEALGVPAPGCLVLEDSVAGVQAGRNAGMYVIMIPDIVEPAPDIRALADQVLGSLHDVEALITEGQLRFV